MPHVAWTLSLSSKGNSVFCMFHFNGLTFSLALSFVYSFLGRVHQFSHSVVSDFLRPHGLQYARPPYPSPTPGAYPNSCPSSQWCHSTTSFSVVPSAPALIVSQLRVFSIESVLHNRWPNYWSFSFNISPSNEYSGLISFRIDWSPCSPRDPQESTPTLQFKSINSSALNFLYIPTLTSIHHYWKNHRLD